MHWEDEHPLRGDPARRGMSVMKFVERPALALFLECVQTEIRHLAAFGKHIRKTLVAQFVDTRDLRNFFAIRQLARRAR